LIQEKKAKNNNWSSSIGYCDSVQMSSLSLLRI
jgi:hypothetical protein